MREFRGSHPGKRRVWRVTPGAPHGEYVEVDAPASRPGEPVEPVERYSPGWAMSSFELTYGLDVTEVGDTMPAELLDELFDKRVK